MKKIIPILLVLFSLVALVWVNSDTLKKANEPANQNANQSAIRIFSTESTYDDAKEDLLASIEENGLVVSYTAHAKAMFDRTADVTSEKIPVYDNAEIILFCKADLSHDLVAADPHNLILCPYAIAIYVLHAEPKKVYFSFREQDKSQEVTKPISDLLSSIIADVL